MQREGISTLNIYVLHMNLFVKYVYFGYKNVLYIKWMVEVRREIFFMIFAPAAVANL